MDRFRILPILLTLLGTACLSSCKFLGNPIPSPQQRMQSLEKERETEPCSLSPWDLLSEPDAEYGSMAYTEMITRDELNWVGRYDPNHLEQPGWRLQFVSGEPPTREQRDRYAQWKADQPRGFDLSEVVNRIDLNSVRMTRRSRRSQYFGFEPTPLPGQDRAMIEPLAGYVSRPTDGRCHLIVEISAEKPFSPEPGVNISQYRYVIVLGRRGPKDLLYPLYTESIIKGTDAKNHTLDSESRFRYSYAY